MDHQCDEITRISFKERMNLEPYLHDDQLFEPNSKTL